MYVAHDTRSFLISSHTSGIIRTIHLIPFRVVGRRSCLLRAREIGNADRLFASRGAAMTLLCRTAASSVGQSSSSQEATALLADKIIEALLRVLVLRARKYGLWVVLAGQDWKSSSLDTAIRDQLATRVQFRAMSASQSRVLLQNAGAEEIEVKGRALAWIPGQDLITLQAPHIGHGAILEAMGSGRGPREAMPVYVATISPSGNGKGAVTPEQVRQVLELHAQGESDTAIAGALWHPTTYYITRVRDILAQQQQQNDNKTGQNGGSGVVVVANEGA